MENKTQNAKISPIEEIIEEARNGKMYILVDDPDRENEGDLIIPAQMATPDAINFKLSFDSFKIDSYNWNDGPCNIPSLAISVEITYSRPFFW